MAAWRISKSGHFSEKGLLDDDAEWRPNPKLRKRLNVADLKLWPFLR